jgi:hypothetical protein
MVATQPHLQENKLKFFLTNDKKVDIIYLYSERKTKVVKQRKKLMFQLRRKNNPFITVRHHVKNRRMLFRDCKGALMRLIPRRFEARMQRYFTQEK